mgnify:CR=1 FL=1
MAEIFSRDELDQCSKEVLITLFLNLQEQMIEINGKLDRLAEQLAVAQNHRYGRKSEKLDVIEGQLCFNFNEAEALLENIYVVEPVDEDVIPTVVKRKKKKGKRKEDLSSLPVETISHTLSEEELTDIFGENGWKQLPDETYMRVKVEPAKYTVEEHHICVYAGKTTDKIVKAFRPKSLLRNSIATPSLVASIMNAKYVNGMPLDRIATDFRRNDGNVPLDNNATESALRNFCMHKHTWRLIDTINGAKASALVYSIVETAKANGLNPFRYLEFLLTEMMEHEEDTDYCFIDNLLPWSDFIPDICKMKNKKEH